MMLLMVLAAQTAAVMVYPVKVPVGVPVNYQAVPAVCLEMEQMLLGVLAIRHQPLRIRAQVAVALH